MKPTLSLLILTALAAPAAAQQADTPGFLYSYEVNDPAAFRKGYAAHLDWHRRAGDRLPWYGWHVIAGARIGQFIDGTFGARFGAIDRRPDLAGDGADFARNTGPYVRASWQTVYRLLPAASGSFTLEQRRPSKFLDVTFVTVRPTAVAAFETALARSKNGAAWYRTLLGDAQPGYLRVMPRADWAALDGAAAPELSSGLMANVSAMRSEVWQYDPALSLLPPAR